MAHALAKNLHKQHLNQNSGSSRHDLSMAHHSLIGLMAQGSLEDHSGSLAAYSKPHSSY
jgi:hypothetical protein